MKPRLIFLYGYPAAGKTTFAKDFVEHNPSFVRISADEIRKEIYGSEDVYGDSFLIYQRILGRMRTSLKEGKDVLYDATNLRLSYRLDYLNELTDIPCFKFIYCFHTKKNVCIQRHLNRGRDIPIESLLPLFDIDEFPQEREGWDKIVHMFSVN